MLIMKDKDVLHFFIRTVL